MSKRQIKAQASSSRASPASTKTGFGGGFGSSASTTSTFGAAASPLSYLAEQPDLTAISDSNVVVNFKNLSKQDSTTKAKALEDLQSYVSSCSEAGQELEDAFLDAWVRVYARASIDISRRVRQDAHTLHGQICSVSGKRIARYMPQIIGPWTAGLYDNDKAVSRAASDALQKVFTTQEKRSNLSRVFQSNILEFARDAALDETAQTLSDERTTNAEDAEAKYWRVIASNLAVVNNLLMTLSETEADGHKPLYEAFVTSPRFLEFLSSKDSSVRRGVLTLLKTYLAKAEELLNNTSQLSEILLSKNVLRHQSGSALQFVETLTAFSSTFPSLWASSPTGKAPPILRLSDLLKSGSQGGPPHYWSAVTTLFDSILDRDLPNQLDQVLKLSQSLHQGISRKDEPRSHAEAAWNCYISVLLRLLTKLSTDEQKQIIQEQALPAIRQYLKPETENVQWNIAGQQAPMVLARFLASSSVVAVTTVEWPTISDTFLERIQTSAPEQSKDYERSQSTVSSEGNRFFSLENQLTQSGGAGALDDAITQATTKIILGCQEMLKARWGKPYGAAGVIEAATRLLSGWMRHHDSIYDSIMSFLLENWPDLIHSPSRKELIPVLYNCKEHNLFGEAWSAALDATMDLSDTALKIEVLRQLLGSPRLPHGFENALRNEKLQDFLVANLRAAVAGGTDLSFLIDVLTAPTEILSQSAADDILADMMSSLGVEDKAGNAIAGLEVVVKKDPSIIKRFLSGSQGQNFLQMLLLITETGNEDLAGAASALHRNLESISTIQAENGRSAVTNVDIISHGLKLANSSSLTIETLVDLAERLLTTEGLSQLTAILPTSEDWSKALEPFLDCTIPPSLVLTNPLGGAVYLTRSQATNGNPSIVTRDRDGYSAALRMARYTTKILSDTKRADVLEDAHRAAIYHLLSLTTQLVNDNNEIHGANDIWRGSDITLEADNLDFVTDSQRLLNAWLSGSRNEFVEIAHNTLLEQSSGDYPTSLHNARAFASSVAESIEMHGWQRKEGSDLEGTLRKLRRGKDVFAFLSYAVAYKVPLAPTPAMTRICNELIADLTGIKLATKLSEAISHLIALNLIINDNDQIVDTIAKQRLIFFIQHVTTWLGEDDATVELKSELTKALTTLLPLVKDVYGTFWLPLLQDLSGSWRQAGNLLRSGGASPSIPYINASLKLAVKLQKLTRDDDSNDDLKDAWKESVSGREAGLVALLKELGQLNDELNLPLQVTNELLGRTITTMAVRVSNELEELYSLMGASSQTIQHTAFNILHKQIPVRQEEISVNVALDKSSARLSEELLSLIIDAPTLDSLVDASFDRVMPPVLQSYLSSWLLVFDHFIGASDKVKADYTEHIKEGEYLNGLLSFVFDFLGHASGKPIDASKFEVTTYSFGIETSPVKDVQWLLIHLYYLCLKRIPALTKSWWMECKSRQVVINVETWTEKFISPFIISDALTTVSEWASSQDANSDEALIVKANHRSKEVMVSKEIDDQLMSLVIRLPNNFPLGQAVLHGVNRVAVDEKKWRSWLLNSQGVITFSNNSLIDGIIAFRRNVVGALKGQTECAICYSLVSADKQLPTKRCATCKNLFHGSCLYRWFKTSNSSSCPLCRNPFNYT